MYPAQTVHPRVGSVFSVPNVRMDQEETDQNTVMNSPAAPDSDTEDSRVVSEQQKPQGSPFRQEETEKAPSHKIVPSSQPNPTLESQPTCLTFQPLVAPTTREPISTASQPGPSTRDDENKPATPPAVIHVRTTPMALPPLLRPTIAQSQRKPDVSNRSQSEPDEIQIHIGRIEVSAISPAAAPTAAKTPRKSSSLDDYLRRRDRRTL